MSIIARTATKSAIHPTSVFGKKLSPAPKTSALTPRFGAPPLVENPKVFEGAVTHGFPVVATAVFDACEVFAAEVLLAGVTLEIAFAPCVGYTTGAIVGAG